MRAKLDALSAECLLGQSALSHTVLVFVYLLLILPSILLSILLRFPLGLLRFSRLVVRLTRLFAVEFHVGGDNLLEGRVKPVVMMIRFLFTLLESLSNRSMSCSCSAGRHSRSEAVGPFLRLRTAPLNTTLTFALATFAQLTLAIHR